MGLLNDIIKKQEKQEKQVKKYVKFTLEEMDSLNFGKFGEELKNNGILPQNFSKNPIEVNIDEVESVPSVELTFKSKTNNDFWVLNIYKDEVSYSKNDNKTLKISSRMTKVWETFAKDARWAIDNDISTNYTKVSIIK